MASEKPAYTLVPKRNQAPPRNFLPFTDGTGRSHAPAPWVCRSDRARRSRVVRYTTGRGHRPRWTQHVAEQPPNPRRPALP